MSGEQLIIDPQSRFLGMKSVQPYSTTDEYLYAMKEDLADWLSNMYPEWRPITADSFLECLENGVLLCQHANNVNDAARRAYSLKLARQPVRSILENCKYRTDARAQTFNARDNVSQFIKWARRVVGVREVLMFETDDIILRKNEKNFLLCLLEIARYGAQFGVSVPIIIKLEDEIEREIQRDKQTEIMSFTELRQMNREENQKNTSTSPTQNKYSKLLKFVRHEHHESPPKNPYNTFSLSHSNGANWLRQHISRIPKLTHHNSKKRLNSEESNESTMYSDLTTTILSNKEQNIPIVSRTLGEGENQCQTPVASSQLHKTVVQMTNTCCCDQRFPVIRLGEGKYRIGENGTIIFIRILRYHVMVRVGGGWDTLENYLNKHDPCRRTGGHRRVDIHDHHRDIPILAVPNYSTSMNSSKSTPFGKITTMKTEDFPLNKSSVHNTDLTDAQLVITRDADGRHRINQISYKSEEDLTSQSHSCTHHQKPIPNGKIQSARGTGRLISKQASPSTDQDYSSYTLSSSTERKHRISKPERVIQQPNVQSQYSEGFIDNIDGCLSSTYAGSDNDFDITDIGDVLRSNQHDDDHTNMDEDSLESCEGVLEIKKKPFSPPTIIPNTKIKSGGVCTAFYLAQKQRQANLSKKSFTIHSYTRSNTLPNVVEAMNKEERISTARRKSSNLSQRSQSTELFDRNQLNDMSKLDRDSGFDEQDFRSERLHSSYDDNSSLSSLKSARSSSQQRSLSSDLNGQIYRENKAYELRLKALDYTRMLNDQSSQDLRLKSSRNSNSRTLPIVHRYRKNTQANLYTKHQ